MAASHRPLDSAAGLTFDRRSFLLGISVAAAQSIGACAMPRSTLGSRTFSTPRQTTQYIERGPADGPLMIFLHGWPSISLMWRAQMDAFAADGWHCVAPDLRGYGGSSAPAANGAYTIEKSWRTWRNSMTTLAASRRSGLATTGALWWPVSWPRMNPSAAVASCWSRSRINPKGMPFTRLSRWSTD